ncbi:hypothetical protein ACJX0J_017841, partial [Zea mays]
DLHPIPEERVVENFNVQENHEAAIFTDSVVALTGLHVIEEHFDDGTDRTLSSEVVSSYPRANGVTQSPSSEHAEILNPFVLMAAEHNKVDISDMHGEATAGYLLDSDDEAGKIYPEPMEGSGIDESFLSELDVVGDFGVEPMRLDQQVHVVSAKYVVKCDNDTFVRLDSVVIEIKKVPGQAYGMFAIAVITFHSSNTTLTFLIFFYKTVLFLPLKINYWIPNI